MSEPHAPSPRRSTARHRRILDAATACVVRDGYAATTIEAVAAEAGAGKQTIYRWWSTKAALYVEVYTDIVSRKALAAPADAPVVERLSALLRQLFRLYRETPAGAILAGLVGASPADPTTRDAVAAGLVIGRADLVGSIVDAAVAAGEIRGSAAIANEIVVAVVWKRLAMAPASLTDAFAARLAAIAIAAAEADPRPEDAT